MAARSLEIAESDLAVAGLAFQNHFYSQYVFHCPQALEKILKAIWFETREVPPPRTHDLRRLIDELAPDLEEEHKHFAEVLSEQYLPSHYADFQAEYPVEAGEYYQERTSELFQWLRQRLNSFERSQTSSND